MTYDMDDSRLNAMAARVAAVVTEEEAARDDKTAADAITPDFVAKCAGFAERGTVSYIQPYSEDSLSMCLKRRPGSSGPVISGSRRTSTALRLRWKRSG